MNKPTLPISSYALIAANLIPLIGVVFFNWDSKVVLALYWIENLIIGAFNVIKMLSVGVLNKNAEAFFLSAFFIVHYGAFCAVHGTILVDILSIQVTSLNSSAIGFLSFYDDGYNVLQTLLTIYGSTIWLGLGMLLLSRFVSFMEHFILRGELFKTQAKTLMTEPYKQITIMHVGLILGAIVLEKLHSPIWLLVIIVLFKTILDYRAHLRKHQQIQELDAELNEQVKDI